jgi:hypothetical protein
MKRRGRITWKVEGGIPARAARLHPYVPELELTPEQAEFLSLHLTLGSLWTSRAVMSVDKRYTSADWIRHEYDYLTFGGWSGTCFPVGTLAVYAGTVRVEEDNRGTPIRLLRHTFIVGGCRYMVATVMELLQPA